MARISMEDLYEETNDIVAEDTTDAEIDAPIYEDEEIESGNDADVIEDALDQVSDVGEGLEAIREMMLESLGNGGMTAGEAAYAQAAVKGVCGRWINPSKTIPSLESFEDSRITATEYALEGIKETLKKWWDSIVKLVNKFIQSIKTFIGKFVAGSGRLERSAKALASKATDVEGEPGDDVELSGTDYSHLVLNGNASKEIIMGGLKEFIPHIKADSVGGASYKVFEAMQTALDKVDVSSKEKVKGSRSDIKAVEFDADKMLGIFQSSAGMAPSTLKPFISTDIKKYLMSTKPFLGDKVFITLMVKDEQNVLERFSVKLENAKPDAKYDSTNKLKCLSSSEIKQMANAVADVAGTVRAAKWDVAKADQHAKKLQNTIDKLIKQIDKGDEKTPAFRWVKRIMGSVSLHVAALTQPQVETSKAALYSSRAAFAYARKSLSNLKTK